MPVEITHKLEKYSSAINPYLLSIVNDNIFIATVIPVGIALDIIFFKNLPLIFSLLGSNANKNEGMPIVIAPIKLN